METGRKLEEIIGESYAETYYRVYHTYQHDGTTEVIQAIIRTERSMKDEPVGTPEWHKAVAALAALSVLLPHGVLAVKVA